MGYKAYGVVKKHIVGSGESKVLSPEEFGNQLEIRNASKEQIESGNSPALTVFEEDEIVGMTEEEIQKLIEDEDPSIQ